MSNKYSKKVTNKQHGWEKWIHDKESSDARIFSEGNSVTLNEVSQRPVLLLWDVALPKIWPVNLLVSNSRSLSSKLIVMT